MNQNRIEEVRAIIRPLGWHFTSTSGHVRIYPSPKDRWKPERAIYTCVNLNRDRVAEVAALARVAKRMG